MPQLTVQQAFDLAVQHHQAGRLADAEALYRQILAVQPRHGDALHFLGVIAGLMGQYGQAVALLGQAIEIRPDNAGAHTHLGAVYRAMGRLDEAIDSYRLALQLQPGLSSTYNDLGNALRDQGRLDDAFSAFQRAIQIKSDYPEAHNNLGNVFRDRGQLDEALAAYRQALDLDPRSLEAQCNLGNVLREQGHLDEAIAAYRTALQIAPDHAVVLCNLGIALGLQGKWDEAIAASRRALELKPDFAEAHNNLGYVLAAAGQLDEAIKAYHEALGYQPRFGLARCNLGNALKDQGQIDGAMAEYREALRNNPNYAEAWSNLLYAFLFLPGDDEATLRKEFRRWNEQFDGSVARASLPHSNARHPDRRLRIGYVSPDLCDHVIGRNLRPLFHHHHRQDFHIICYSGVVKPDELTEEFRQHSDQWRNVVGVGDETLCEMIRADEVDILVDLTQHLAGNRLVALTRRPAPIQASFAGYPESAGVAAIGHRISDRYVEAEIPESEIGEERELRRKDSIEPRIDTDETRIRKNPREVPASSAPSVLIRVHPWLNSTAAEQIFLIDSFWCYDPSDSEVAIHALPAQSSGRIAFGCLNNFCKVNEPMLKLWARVLKQTEDSTLTILADEGSHRQRVLEILVREGIETPRVVFVSPRPRRQYLELYRCLDIVLDTFPYNGHTTSLDALWMGVPVVSLAGECAVSRAGLSQLTNLGLRELVAFNEEDYVKIAVQLARDLPRLAELRSTLRPRMEKSVLMDAPRFARQIEAAYRAMWREWCAKEAGK